MKKYTKRNAPFGYTADADGKLIEEPEQMETVREIIKLHETGASLTAVAGMLNEVGTPTARGGKWYSSTVRSVVDHYYDKHGDDLGEPPSPPATELIRLSNKPLALRIRDKELNSLDASFYGDAVYEEEFTDPGTGKKSTRERYISNESHVMADAQLRAYATLTREQQDALVSIPDPTLCGADTFIKKARQRMGAPGKRATQ